MVRVVQEATGKVIDAHGIWASEKGRNFWTLAGISHSAIAMKDGQYQFPFAYAGETNSQGTHERLTLNPGWSLSQNGVVLLQNDQGQVFSHILQDEDYVLDFPHPHHGEMLAVWSGQYDSQGNPAIFHNRPIVGALTREHIGKIRRRIEDKLRKSQPIEILKVASLLGVKLT